MRRFPTGRTSACLGCSEHVPRLTASRRCADRAEADEHHRPGRRFGNIRVRQDKIPRAAACETEAKAAAVLVRVLARFEMSWRNDDGLGAVDRQKELIELRRDHIEGEIDGHIVAAAKDVAGAEVAIGIIGVGFF